MDYEETMVEEEFDDTEADDTLPDGIVEEDESEEDFPDEEELEIPDEESEESDEDYEELPQEEEEPDDTPPPSEPGWMKKRIGKAVEKAVRETEARMQAMFEQQMKPIREKMIEDAAQELVRTRKVGDIETARELVRYRQNMPAEQPRQQLRDNNGQFATQEQVIQSAKDEARINELYSQAQKIRAKGGPDVMKEFLSNAEVKQKVVRGEMDFYDVADLMKKPAKKKPPTPMRSPNGATNMTSNAFSSMSDKQFERFERKLDEGVRYTMR